MTAPLTARQLRARQVVLAAGTLDAWQAKFERYGTTTNSCLCPDWQIRGRRNEITACKHMEAKRLLEGRQAADTGVSTETIEIDPPEIYPKAGQVADPGIPAASKQTPKVDRLALVPSQIGNWPEVDDQWAEPAHSAGLGKRGEG